MRVRRALVANVLALVSGLAVDVLAVPAVAASRVVGKVTVDPQSGPPTTSIDAQFQISGGADQGCPQFKVIFKWDGHTVGADNLNHCVATVSFKPPKAVAKPGVHWVAATDDKGVVLGRNFFLVTVPDPSGSPVPDPSSSVSASPSKSKGAKPGATTIVTEPADDPAPPPPVDTGPTVDGSVAAVNAGVDSGSGGEETSMMAVALMFGGALVLGGVVILGFLVMRGQRGEPDDALVESPTQPIPTYPSTFNPPPDSTPTR